MKSCETNLPNIQQASVFCRLLRKRTSVQKIRTSIGCQGGWFPPTRPEKVDTGAPTTMLKLIIMSLSTIPYQFLACINNPTAITSLSPTELRKQVNQCSFKTPKIRFISNLNDGVAMFAASARSGDMFQSSNERRCLHFDDRLQKCRTYLFKTSTQGRKW